MADIFISYKSEDRNKIAPLARALENQGWDVWWDRELIGGDEFETVIPKELTEARCIIVAWSKLAIESHYVKDEARLANKARKLVPILLEPIEPPFGHGGIQAEDFSTWTGGEWEQQFIRLCAAIRAKLKGPTGPAPAPGPGKPPEQPRPGPPRGKLWRWLTAAAVLGLVPVGGLIWLWWPWVTMRDYQVFIRYWGIESGDIRELKGKLRGIGWNVIQSEPENSPDARGRNDVRYREDSRVANLLAQQVTIQDLGSEEIGIKPVRATQAKTLEVWISRPELITAPPPVPPPAQPPPPVPPVPAPQSLDVDIANWNSRPPDRAHCMQRKNSDAGPGKFLIRCFKTEDLCRRVQRTDSGDRTPCVATTGLQASPLWRQAGPGGIQDSWFKYSDQQFPPPFPQFDTPDLEPARYKVSIWFAGSLDREKDIVPLSQKLRALGWDAQVPRAAGGGDRTQKAIGMREVRYSGSENQRAADVLVESVNKLGVVPAPVKAAASPGIEAKELQLWISR